MEKILVLGTFGVAMLFGVAIFGVAMLFWAAIFGDAMLFGAAIFGVAMLFGVAIFGVDIFWNKGEGGGWVRGCSGVVGVLMIKECVPNLYQYSDSF